MQAASRHRALGLAMLIVAATLLVFGQVVCHELLHWDDNQALSGNPDFLSPQPKLLPRLWLHPTAGYNGFYVPVTYTVWWVVANVARSAAPGEQVVLDPAAFHLLNLLFHTAAAVMVFLILRRLVKSDVPATLGALLFALHPLQTEPVSWASTMYTPLSGLLALAALWLYLVFSDRRDDPHDAHPARAWFPFAAATLCFVLGLLTKPTIVVLPLIAAVIELLLRGKNWKRCAPLVLWLLIGAVAALITRQNHEGEFALVPALWLRPVVALDAIAFYIWKVIAPFYLAPDYGRSPRWLLAHPGVWATALVPVALLVAAWAARRRLPWLTAGVLVFMIAPVATLGLVPFSFQVYSTVADRYAYLAIFGAALLLAYFLHWSTERQWRPALPAALALLAACGFIAHAQGAYWHDTPTLMAHNLDVNPTSLAGEGVMGDLLFIVGTPDSRRQGFEFYRAAVRDHPDDPIVHQSLGWQLFQSGNYREAADMLGQASRLAPRRVAPAYWCARALAAANDAPGAIAAFTRAVRIDPNFEDARLRLADLLASAGRPGDAAGYYQSILRDHPDAKDVADRLRNFNAHAGVDVR